MRLDVQQSILMLIDFQTRLVPAMFEPEELVMKSKKLMQGCKSFGIPYIATQQYTKGLGETIPELAQVYENFMAEEKTSFSCLGSEKIKDLLIKSGKRTVIIAGIEGHVCVQQTVLELLETGYTAVIAADCISSRFPRDRDFGFERMQQEGAVLTTMEAILFELCADAKNPLFKTISGIVKE